MIQIKSRLNNAVLLNSTAPTLSAAFLSAFFGSGGGNQNLYGGIFQNMFCQYTTLTAGSAFNFAGMDFTGSDFTGCNFSGCNFYSCILTNVSFGQCILTNVDFANCECQNVNFNNANMTGGAVIGSNCAGASFAGTTTLSTVFTGQYMANANTFGAPSLTSAVFV